MLLGIVGPGPPSLHNSVAKLGMLFKCQLQLGKSRSQLLQCRGLDNCRYDFEVYLRYPIV